MRLGKVAQNTRFCEDFLGAATRTDLFFIFFKTRYSREPRPKGAAIRNFKKIKKRKKAEAKFYKDFAFRAGVRSEVFYKDFGDSFNFLEMRYT